MTSKIYEVDQECRELMKASQAIPDLCTLTQELVYNSIDNKATCVAVRINVNSSARIQVIDNGQGVKDIDKLCSGQRQSKKSHFSSEVYGTGRGALSHIIKLCGSVTVTSRRHNNTYTKGFSDGKSKLSREKKTRKSKGASVTVDAIFCKIPVRSTTLSYIDIEKVRRMLLRVAIANPSVAFSLKDLHSGKKLLQTEKSNSYCRNFSMYSNECISTDEMRIIRHIFKGYSIVCLISLQLINRPKQLFFVNRRYVQDTRLLELANDFLLAALLPNNKKDFENLLPSFAFFIECKYSKVDICFQDNSFINFISWHEVLTLIYEALRIFLEEEDLSVPSDSDEDQEVHLEGASAREVLNNISPPGHIKSNNARRPQLRNEEVHSPQKIFEMPKPLADDCTEYSSRRREKNYGKNGENIKNVKIVANETPCCKSSKSFLQQLERAPKIIPRNSTQECSSVLGKRKFSTPVKDDIKAPLDIDISPIVCVDYPSGESPRSKRHGSFKKRILPLRDVPKNTKAKVAASSTPWLSIKSDSGYNTVKHVSPVQDYHEDSAKHFMVYEDKSSNEVLAKIDTACSPIIFNCTDSFQTFSSEKVVIDTFDTGTSLIKPVVDKAVSPIKQVLSPFKDDKKDVQALPLMPPNVASLPEVSSDISYDIINENDIKNFGQLEEPNSKSIMISTQNILADVNSKYSMHVVQKLQFASQDIKEAHSGSYTVIEALPAAQHITANLSPWRKQNMQPEFKESGIDIQKWRNPVFDTAGEPCLKGRSNIPLAVKVITDSIRFNRDSFDSLQVLDQVDDKFILCVIDGVIVAVDQHAAHERIRLECMMSDLKTECDGKSIIRSHHLQNPLHLTVSKHDTEMIKTFKSKFFLLGFYIDVRTKTLCLITSIPKVCFTDSLELNISNADIEAMFKETLEQLCSSSGCDLSIPKSLVGYLNSKACHGAIRFGDSLTKEQCVMLINQLSFCRLPWQCAHGRPSVAPLSKLSAKPDIPRELNLIKLRSHFQHHLHFNASSK